jgi:hypothetical protein
MLGINSPHISTSEQANTLFKLEQFLNRDKVKLGLNERAARQELRSDLQREDIRTRDRLKDLRSRIMNEAVGTLFARIMPIRTYTPVHNNDFGFLIRLEDIEDKIANANDQLRHSVPDSPDESTDDPKGLHAIQKLIKPNEALLLHVFVGGIGLVTTCVDSSNWTFDFAAFDQPQLMQMIIDEKLVSAAVHGTHEPSALLDSSFPAESSHRLYRLLFGGAEACLKGKTHILLATDADLFALPWNAFVRRQDRTDDSQSQNLQEIEVPERARHRRRIRPIPCRFRQTDSRVEKSRASARNPYFMRVGKRFRHCRAL